MFAHPVTAFFVQPCGCSGSVVTPVIVVQHSILLIEVKLCILQWLAVLTTYLYLFSYIGFWLPQQEFPSSCTFVAFCTRSSNKVVRFVQYSTVLCAPILDCQYVCAHCGSPHIVDQWFIFYFMYLDCCIIIGIVRFGLLPYLWLTTVYGRHITIQLSNHHRSVAPAKFLVFFQNSSDWTSSHFLIILHFRNLF